MTFIEEPSGFPKLDYKVIQLTPYDANLLSTPVHGIGDIQSFLRTIRYNINSKSYQILLTKDNIDKIQYFKANRDKCKNYWMRIQILATYLDKATQSKVDNI